MANVENARRMAATLNIVASDLTARELGVFRRSFKRQFIQSFPERDMVGLYKRHEDEILMAAMVAKAQMRAEIDGEIPAPGRVGGPLTMRACYMGLSDDWENTPDFTTATPQNWIHSGTIAGGTAGRPIKIGENAVHIILGIGNLHPSPKVESVQFTIDGKERPIYNVGTKLKTSGLQIKEFDTSLLLKQGSTFNAKVVISDAFGTTVTDYPYLIGVSFINEAQLRILDPTTVALAVNDVVLST